ncbi:four helix bundle protein [Candidatus Woesearchaeota archaeon]|nr:four helix bundle protein [Candidatus Woesearchaeota archaeon]
MARNYEKLEVWNLSYQFVLKLYDATEDFPEDEKGNIIQQIRRAAISIPLNIAEGCSRYSKNAFLQFLSYAYGSIKELHVLLMLSKDLGYLNNEEYIKLIDDAEIISRKLFVFIDRVKKEKWFDWFK